MDTIVSREKSAGLAACPEPYNGLAKTFHWLTAALIFVALPTAWYFDELAKDDPALPWWVTLHKSVGLTVLALTVLRLIWLRLAPPPPLGEAFAPIQRMLAHATHGLLYLALLAMPISGYVMSAAKGREIPVFWLFKAPLLTPVDETLAHFAKELHEVGQWALCALVGVHILSAIFHGVARRDGVLSRMLPGRRAA